METQTIQRKWTTKTGGLDKPALQEIIKENKTKKPVPIYFIMAMVSSVKEEQNKLNSAVMNFRFKGNFEVKNLITGEVSLANEAYFPGAAETHAKNAYDDMVRRGGEAQAFAFTLTVEKDTHPNSATGYKFGLDALVNKEAGDVFENLRKLLPKPAQK